MSQSDRKILVHMVGNAHIDPVWLWPLAEGRTEVLSTYRTALMLLDEFPDYVFTSGGAVTYEWVRQDDPALFRRIQEFVAEGRWVLVNGWWLQPDCNIPHGESFVRHGLYGQRYLQQHFGTRATVGYNVDSFGHAGTLPQILRECGLDYYVFFRPGPHEMALPAGPYWWQSPDGSRVLACRPPLHYGSPEDDDVVARARQAADDMPADLDETLCFYGVGNHGGGPTRHNVRQLAALQAADQAVAPIFSSPDAYFGRMAALGRDWPVVADELQHHARGCYTALSRVKRENRQAEHALLPAERWDALAGVQAGSPRASAALQMAWENVLFNQFHDILAGTSLRSAYDDVWHGYAQSRAIANRVQEQALQALQQPLEVPERQGQQPVVLWNPSPWPRHEAVHLVVPMGGWRHDFAGSRYPAAPTVRDVDGQVLPSQLARVVFDYNTYLVHLDVLAEVPALGARLVYVEIPETDPPEQDLVAPPCHTIENAYLRVTVDPHTGWLASLYDKRAGCELLAGPGCVPLVIEDASDTWSHDVKAFREVIGRFVASAPVRLLEDGPVKQVLRIESAWGDSRLVLDLSLTATQPTLDVTLTIDWHERYKMLKLGLPLALEGVAVTTDAPYGHTQRPADGEEHPCQAWVDLTGQGFTRRWGVSLLNDSKYGYDALEAELRLSLLRSPIYAFHNPRVVRHGVEYSYTDQGEQTVRLSLAPHAGEWSAATPHRLADALQEPLLAQAVAPQAGETPPASWLSVSPDNVLLTVVKGGEEGQGLIVRGMETSGVATQVTLRSEALDQSWCYAARPFELFTLALPLDGGPARRLNALEEPA
jgi:alpha-mannosidase